MQQTFVPMVMARLRHPSTHHSQPHLPTANIAQLTQYPNIGFTPPSCHFYRSPQNHLTVPQPSPNRRKPQRFTSPPPSLPPNGTRYQPGCTPYKACTHGNNPNTAANIRPRAHRPAYRTQIDSPTLRRRLGGFSTQPIALLCESGTVTICDTFWARWGTTPASRRSWEEMLRWREGRLGRRCRVVAGSFECVIENGLAVLLGVVVSWDLTRVRAETVRGSVRRFA